MHVRRKLLERWLLCGALLLDCGFLLAPAQAQTPAAVLGQVVGDDVSIIGPSNPVTNAAAPATEFSSGSTIVVHSGKARVDFAGGGELDVCGPAKFTVLSSDQALTVALSFGRVHARFDASRPIAIYTPLIIATPLPIGDHPRDATIGLANTGAMCILAARGAVRLQNQLTGEVTIVPQPSEVALQGESFATLPAAVGQCRCEFDQPSATQRAPLPPAVSSPTPAATASEPQPQNQPNPVPVAATPALAPKQEPISSPPSPKPTPAGSIVRPQPPPSPASLAATTMPTVTIGLPSIGYDSPGVPGTAEPLSVATLLLAQEVVVQREWIFHGTVFAPGEGGKNTPVSSAEQTSTNAQKPKKGFWAKFRDFWRF